MKTHAENYLKTEERKHGFFAFQDLKAYASCLQ